MKEENEEENKKKQQAEELKKILELKEELNDNTLKDVTDIIYNEKIKKHKTEKDSKEER